MGFNSTATTTTLTAKLTPLGRQKLVTNNNSLIASFSLGDSDANYNVVYPLITGEIPSDGGTIGVSGATNSTSSNMQIRSVLTVNSSGNLKKSVEPQSITIITTPTAIGQTTISGSNISYNLINRNDFNTDPLVNLFYSFGLPLNSTQDIKYTATTSNANGFADTALSGLAKTKILVIGLNNSTYGEILDGKSINLSLTTSGGTYSIYSTFQNTGISLTTQDVAIVDSAISTQGISNNIAFLFSDTIMRPNGGNPSLSWSTGYNKIKPFSLNQKQLYNFTSNPNLALTADTAVGIAYLDKGLLVITNQTIISAYTASTATTITGTTINFNSVSTDVSQNITCIADRGEFGGSTNPTFGPTDIPRISEVILYDNSGNIIALAKPDRQILKNVNQFLAIGVKISL